MPKLSDHFSEKDFVCRCPECRGEAYRIHLGLVGALEMMAEYFRKTPKILSAYWCEALNEKIGSGRKSPHAQGKAAHIQIEGVNPVDLFKFAEGLSEINGLGFYADDNFIHIDTMDRNIGRDMWVKKSASYSQLTPEKRQLYGL